MRNEGTKKGERASFQESTEGRERAMSFEGTMKRERPASKTERAIFRERAKV